MTLYTVAHVWHAWWYWKVLVTLGVSLILANDQRS